MNYKNRFKTGFTLTEILITLGIIGVVSALTVPTLMRDHQKKVYAIQLNKVMNDFTQAADAYIHDRNSMSLFEAGVRNQAGLDSFVRANFKIVKNCGSTFTDCFATNYKNMNSGAVTNYNAAGSNCYALPSGAVACLSYVGDVDRAGGGFIDMVVDTNGKSGPNIVGRDLFTMGIGRDGSLGSGIGFSQLGCMVDKFTGQASQACLEELNKTDLQKCQRAAAMTIGGDSSYCYVQMQNDGFVMNY